MRAVGKIEEGKFYFKCVTHDGDELTVMWDNTNEQYLYLVRINDNENIITMTTEELNKYFELLKELSKSI